MLLNKVPKMFSILNLSRIRAKRKFARGPIFTAKDKEYKNYNIGEFTCSTPKIEDMSGYILLSIFCSIFIILML